MASILLEETATLPEIDEALAHLRAVNETERGPAWTAYLDAILELRAKQSATTPHFSQDINE